MGRVPIWRVGGKSVIRAGPLQQALKRETALTSLVCSATKKNASNCVASSAWNAFLRDRSQGSLLITMPRRPSGHFRWTGNVAVARVRSSSDAREGFAMPTCRTDAEASERAQVLAGVAERPRVAGVEIDKARKALEMVAIAAPRQLSNALAVAAELVDGELRPKGAPAVPHLQADRRSVGIPADARSRSTGSLTCSVRASSRSISYASGPSSSRPPPSAGASACTISAEPWRR
jgi:hypothetical protein